MYEAKVDKRVGYRVLAPPGTIKGDLLIPATHVCISEDTYRIDGEMYTVFLIIPVGREEEWKASNSTRWEKYFATPVVSCLSEVKTLTRRQFRHAIVTYLATLGWSQQRLADSLEISQAALSHMINLARKGEPRIATIRKCIAALRTSEAAFYAVARQVE